MFTPLDWSQEDTEVPGDNTHLWEESWDDDDTSEDFSAQLKYVLPYHTLIPRSILHLPAMIHPFTQSVAAH